MMAAGGDFAVTFLHVVSEVNARFASTELTSRMVNTARTAQEVHFTATLPNAAFIGHFEM